MAQDSGTVTKPPVQAAARKLTQFQNYQPDDPATDSLIKAKIVELAINNPQVDVADEQIKIAQYGLDKAKSSWLSLISASSNINEFVINNKKIDSVPVASYYPKYNLGITIPFDIFSKTKNEKRIAAENISVARSLKQDRIRITRVQVLTLYENYKEKKELLRLQKVSMDGDNDSYISAQKKYADGTIQLEEMNRAYQDYIGGQSKIISSQRDFNVATIELEQAVGESMEDVIRDALTPKVNP